MVDLVEAARAAVFTRLIEIAPDQVFDHIPQDTQPPFRHIGEIEWQGGDSKFDGTITVTIELITLYRGEDRSELVEMVHQNRVALHDQDLPAEGALIELVAEVAGSISDAAADGVTYAAVQHFEMHVEPA
jgi:hypothetical protein